MEPHLEVDPKSNLIEVPNANKNYSRLVRTLAVVISYIFHPLFIPVYLAVLILKEDAFLFAAFTDLQKKLLMGTFCLMYILFPLVSVLLLRALGFIQSIHLKTQRDRIIPYVICMIWYWWVWYVLINRAEIPKECVVLSLAIFLASIGGLMANISMKISMHAMAAGVMVAYVTWLGFSQDLSFGIYISLSILLAGAICTARLMVGNHTNREIYTGLLVGILSLALATQFD